MARFRDFFIRFGCVIRQEPRTGLYFAATANIKNHPDIQGPAGINVFIERRLRVCRVRFVSIAAVRKNIGPKFRDLGRNTHVFGVFLVLGNK